MIEEEAKARALGRVKLAAGKLGRASKARDEAIVAALDAGNSSRAVAEAAGMSSPGVLDVRKRHEASS